MKKLILLAMLALAPAWADTAASIQKVEGATVTFARNGVSAKAGDRLTVTRNGQKVAEVELTDVNDSTIQGRVVQIYGNEGPVAGDVVTSPGGGVATFPTSFKPGEAPPNPAGLEDAERLYREQFESRTEKENFRQVAPHSRSYENFMPGSGLLDIYQAADLLGSSFGPGGFYGDPTLLLFSAYSAISARQSRDNLYDTMDVQMEIEVTYWDEALLDSYVKYAAISGGQTAPDKYAALKNMLYAQKGLGGNRVFEVRLRNTGKLKAQLSPFHWHMFTMGPNNSRVAATRYDQVLDREIKPGEEVSGNIYFPKVESGNSKTMVLMEDIYGDRKEIEFSGRN